MNRTIKIKLILTNRPILEIKKKYKKKKTMIKLRLRKIKINNILIKITYKLINKSVKRIKIAKTSKLFKKKNQKTKMKTIFQNTFKKNGIKNNEEIMYIKGLDIDY